MDDACHSSEPPAGGFFSPFRLAILVDPKEDMPPSDEEALRHFIHAGRNLGMIVHRLTKADLHVLKDYDGLFMRTTTETWNITAEFAKLAEHRNIVCIDSAESTVRCTDKIFQERLWRQHEIPRPLTLMVGECNLAEVDRDIAYPIVLKVPNGSFSNGVCKVDDHAALIKVGQELLKKHPRILAQEFVYTPYDWRIGVLNRQPIFACQYFMVPGHWQIYQYNHCVHGGDSRAFHVEDAPLEVVETAVKAANLIGDGLYGVDMKMTDRGPMVIEVNDNPNIDSGVEDMILGDELYKIVMREFKRRMTEMAPYRQFGVAYHAAAVA